jgi:hypothetical protein
MAKELTISEKRDIVSEWATQYGRDVGKGYYVVRVREVEKLSFLWITLKEKYEYTKADCEGDRTFKELMRTRVSYSEKSKKKKLYNSVFDDFAWQDSINLAFQDPTKKKEIVDENDGCGRIGKEMNLDALTLVPPIYEEDEEFTKLLGIKPNG